MGSDAVSIGWNPDGFELGLRRGSMTRLYASGLDDAQVAAALPDLLEILQLETARERDAALRELVEARSSKGETGEP